MPDPADTRGALPVSVADVMTPDPVTLTPDDLVAAAAAVMRERHCRHVPVTDAAGALVGIVSSQDVIGVDPHETRLAEVMTRDPLSAAPGDPVERAAATMAARKVSALPVVEGGAVVGIVTTYDLLDVLARRLRGR